MPNKSPLLLFLATCFSLTLLSQNSTSSPEDRVLTSPSQNLVTYVGLQKFKPLSQPGLTSTYVISTPGTYVLTDDIPSIATTGQIISITCSQVIFDMAGKSITLAAGGGTSIDGFTISPSLSNIIIRNGTINTMTNNGITVGAACTNIRCEDLTISGCAQSGISFAGSTGNSLIGCSLENCTILNTTNSTTTSYGLKLSYCDYFTAKNCSFIAGQALGTSQNCYGVYAINSKNGTFLQCDARGNKATLVAAGFYIDTGCSCFVFENCSSKTQTSTATAAGGKAYGFFETGASNNQFKNCVSIQASSFTLSTGFYSQNCNFSYYSQCIANNNTVSGTSGTPGAYGFLVDTATSQGIMFDTCTASGNANLASAAGRGCGFALDACFGCAIKNCIAQANAGGTGFGIGINIEPGAVRCYIQNNSIIGNTSATTKRAYGIWDEGLTSTTLLTGNSAFGNRDETASPTDQNFVTVYASTNSVQAAAKNNIKSLNGVTAVINTSITP